MTNRQALENLLTDGGIDLRRGALFDRAPDPLPPGFDFERIEGLSGRTTDRDDGRIFDLLDRAAALWAAG